MNLSKKESRYVYVDGFISRFQWLWIASFLALGIIVLAGGKIIGGFSCLAIGALAFLFRDGIQMDEGRKRIRNYTKVFGISWGKWYPLENFKYIVVSPTVAGRRPFDYANMFSFSTSFKYKIFLSSVNIYKQPSMILGEFSNKDHSIKKATEMGRLLKFDVKINQERS